MSDDLYDVVKVLFSALLFAAGLLAGSLLPRPTPRVAPGDIRGTITNCASAACDGVCLALPSTCSVFCGVGGAP